MNSYVINTELLNRSTSCAKLLPLKLQFDDFESRSQCKTDTANYLTVQA